MDVTAKCSVEGCENKLRAKGFCISHYWRMKRYGDPLAGNTYIGEPRKFYEETVLAYEGDECLIWPYAKGGRAARLSQNGRLQVVPRMVCEAVNGSPPTPDHEAAHECGNGHLGCVTKRHLSWKTSAENAADRFVHGTQQMGENHPKAKLTAIDVKEIRSLKGIETQVSLAKRFKINQATVSSIQLGKSWARLES